VASIELKLAGVATYRAVAWDQTCRSAISLIGQKRLYTSDRFGAAKLSAIP
jgi:hypothetical protein